MLLLPAVASNGRMVATGSQDRTLKLWSAEDGGLQGVCRGHKRGIWSVAFSPVRTSHTEEIMAVFMMLFLCCSGHSNMACARCRHFASV